MENTLHTKRHLLKTIFLLAWPTIIEQLLQTVAVYINTAMIGGMGQNASAAVGLSSTIV